MKSIIQEFLLDNFNEFKTVNHGECELSLADDSFNFSIGQFNFEYDTCRLKEDYEAKALTKSEDVVLYHNKYKDKNETGLKMILKSKQFKRFRKELYQTIKILEYRLEEFVLYSDIPHLTDEEIEEQYNIFVNEL